MYPDLVQQLFGVFVCGGITIDNWHGIAMSCYKNGNFLSTKKFFFVKLKKHKFHENLNNETYPNLKT
jgi:hypothetical protein